MIWKSSLSRPVTASPFTSVTVTGTRTRSTVTRRGRMPAALEEDCRSLLTQSECGVDVTLTSWPARPIQHVPKTMNIFTKTLRSLCCVVSCNNETEIAMHSGWCCIQIALLFAKQCANRLAVSARRQVLITGKSRSSIGIQRQADLQHLLKVWNIQELEHTRIGRLRLARHYGAITNLVTSGL